MDQISWNTTIDSCKGILLAWVSDCVKLWRMLKHGTRYDRAMAATLLLCMPVVLIVVSAVCAYAICLTVAAKIVVEAMPLIVILFIGAVIWEILW